MGGYSGIHRRKTETLRKVNLKLERVEAYLTMVREGSTATEIAEEMELTERQVLNVAKMSSGHRYEELKKSQVNLENWLGGEEY